MEREALEDLRRAVRRMLADRSPMSSVRATMEAGAAARPGPWHALVEDLGVVGQTVGADGGATATLAVAEEPGGWSSGNRTVAVRRGRDCGSRHEGLRVSTHSPNPLADGGDA